MQRQARRDLLEPLPRMLAAERHAATSALRSDGNVGPPSEPCPVRRTAS
jgi:hypothetical protein